MEPYQAGMQYHGKGPGATPSPYGTAPRAEDHAVQCAKPLHEGRLSYSTRSVGRAGGSLVSHLNRAGIMLEMTGFAASGQQASWAAVFVITVQVQRHKNRTDPSLAPAIS